MKRFALIVFFFSLICLLGATAFGQMPEQIFINIKNEAAPPSGWAVFHIELTEPRPVRSGQGCVAATDPAAGASPGLPLFLFSPPPLLLVENSRGEVSYQIVEYGPDGILFSFESSADDVGTFYDPRRPFAYLALRVNPDAPLGAQAVISMDTPRMLMYDEMGRPLPVLVNADGRAARFTVGGLSISCMSPLTGMVTAGQPVTIYGVGFDRTGRVDVHFDEIEAHGVRVIDEHTIETTAPRSFLADTVEVQVRNRRPGPNGQRPRNSFVSYRFGCFEE